MIQVVQIKIQSLSFISVTVLNQKSLENNNSIINFIVLAQNGSKLSHHFLQSSDFSSLVIPTVYEKIIWVWGHRDCSSPSFGNHLNPIPIWKPQACLLYFFSTIMRIGIKTYAKYVCSAVLQFCSISLRHSRIHICSILTALFEGFHFLCWKLKLNYIFTIFTI